MTDEEIKNKCTERAKIFQQAMESCHSSSPMDCIEWFADRIAELEATNKKISDECHKLVDTLEKKQNENKLLETQNIKLQAEVSKLTIKKAELEKENAELEKELKAEKEYSVTLRKEIDEYTNSHTLCAKYKKLEAQIEKMKADVRQGQSYWNSGEMQYNLYQRLLDKWEIKEK